MNVAENEKTPDKLTDNEIIEALKYCSDPNNTCDNCVLFVADDDSCECASKLRLAALDLINRTQAALEKSLNALCKKEDLMQLLAMERQQYYDELQKAKAITGELRHLYEQAKSEAAEVKHGEWITDRSSVEVEFTCSECGFNYIEADSSQNCDYNYCPNCGAKMDGKKKEGAGNE